MIASSVLFTISSCAIALSNLINGHRNLSQSREFRKENLEIDKIKARENIENEKLKHERNIEIETFKANLGSLEKQRNINLEKFGVYFTNGNFLKVVAPNSTYPIVLFDTVLRHSTTRKDDNFVFNPMESLYHSFKTQNQKFCLNCNVLSIKAGFSSEVDVLSFYNNEFYNVPAIIIYGSFDGNKLRINATYGGLDEYQFWINDNNVFEIKERNANSLLLSEIKLSLINDAINLDKPNEAQVARENLQQVIDIITITSIQGLIDSYHSLFSPTFKPLIDNSLKTLNELMSGFTPHSHEELIEMVAMISNYRKHIIEQRDRVHRKKVRHKVQNKNSI